MNPWIILGWMLVALFALSALWLFVRFFVIGAIVAWQMGRTWREEARIQRAQDGKLRCEHKDCQQIATHSVSGRRFYCLEHARGARAGLTIPLRHARKANQEDK